MKTIKELLALKRDGVEWTQQEVESFIVGVVSGTVSPAQTAAFLMAACIRGLTDRETATLTRCMAASGESIRTGLTSRPCIDKHSTGGVADSVSLLLTPLAVACGLAVPMISGRGLGHTGGTVDKLESVSGFQTILGVPRLEELLASSHMFMAGQSERIAPADRILYALRDVTGTVENPGLITASILSKKMAEGITGLVMDVKVGRAAFMKTRQDANILASALKDVGEAAGLRMAIVFSRMDSPLGNAIGNWVEIHEAERALADRSTASVAMVEVTVELVARMLILGDLHADIVSARSAVYKAWDDGAAFDRFHDMVSQQGGNWTASLEQYRNVPREVVHAQCAGNISDIDAMILAQAILTAGGGRQKDGDIIDSSVGIVLERRIGDAVQAGDAVAVVYASAVEKVDGLKRAVLNAVKTTTAPVEQEPSYILDVW